MLNSGLSESHSSEIRFPESYSTTMAFLRYIYADSLPKDLSTNDVCELLKLANMYFME
ncbi:hypothetical protein HK102_003778, partial [Quaeritorhiza haematococci]